ncbi:MAG: hypothetical protein LBO05_05900 [Deltaproteobacteria bacterium]|jgi:hypothetical protein|nr:hypothetical protein [Deltaproteobacteria bacterium]
MDDWLNLINKNSDRPRSLRGPLILLVMLVMTALAFWLLHKMGRSRMPVPKPAGRSEAVLLADNSPDGGGRLGYGFRGPKA